MKFQDRLTKKQKHVKSYSCKFKGSLSLQLTLHKFMWARFYASIKQNAFDLMILN